ncbi:MAG: pyrroline-5-carboxylate reductase [Rhodospirillaceae bacterium]|nr:pyrroline-5-carboxylate reductase [Rhodospirillaceae bacterium]
MAKLLLVGCGKMGGALARGWIANAIPITDITIIEPNTDAGGVIFSELGIKAISSIDDLPAGYSPDFIFLAVKPQNAADALAPYAALASANTTFVSIMAGKTISSLAAILGKDANIVRAMPNTPAAIGRGITVAVADGSTSKDAKKTITGLLEAVGQAAWVDDEKMMDAVTAVSGSGPAYIFLLAEAMSHAGVMAGLSVELADKLARETVAGSGELLGRSNETAKDLRENVTSPGGTTAAALEILMANGGMKDLMVSAIDAATKRSRELAD